MGLDCRCSLGTGPQKKMVCHSARSPLAGEGWGGGYGRATSPTPTPTLPRKGGGRNWAPVYLMIPAGPRGEKLKFPNPSGPESNTIMGSSVWVSVNPLLPLGDCHVET